MRAPACCLAPKRQDVCILFSDVRGFTELSAQRAPADIADRIATLQRWTLLAVERHHGIVARLVGNHARKLFPRCGLRR